MPLYEFECKSCGAINEMLMKVSDPMPTSCLTCEGGPLTKLMSRTNFILKGQGWYETDFKNKPKPKGNATPAAASTNGDTAGSTTTTSAATSDDSGATKSEAPAAAKAPAS